MNARGPIMGGAALTLVLVLAACGDLATEPSSALAGPSQTLPSENREPLAIPASGTITTSDAARVGLRADERCASPETVALLQSAITLSETLVSRGGYTTDYSGLLNWNLRMAGAASFPTDEDLQVPQPDGLFAVCWYTGSFTPQSSVTGIEAATANSMLVVYDGAGLRNVVVSRIGPIGIIAPDLPAGTTEATDLFTALDQMTGTRIVEGQSLFDLRTAEGKPSPVPGER